MTDCIVCAIAERNKNIFCKKHMKMPEVTERMKENYLTPPLDDYEKWLRKERRKKE